MACPPASKCTRLGPYSSAIQKLPSRSTWMPSVSSPFGSGLRRVPSGETAVSPVEPGPGGLGSPVMGDPSMLRSRILRRSVSSVALSLEHTDLGADAGRREGLGLLGEVVVGSSIGQDVEVPIRASRDPRPESSIADSYPAHRSDRVSHRDRQDRDRRSARVGARRHFITLGRFASAPDSQQDGEAHEDAGHRRNIALARWSRPGANFFPEQSSTFPAM